MCCASIGFIRPNDTPALGAATYPPNSAQQVEKKAPVEAAGAGVPEDADVFEKLAQLAGASGSSQIVEQLPGNLHVVPAMRERAVCVSARVNRRTAQPAFDFARASPAGVCARDG